MLTQHKHHFVWQAWEKIHFQEEETRYAFRVAGVERNRHKIVITRGFMLDKLHRTRTSEPKTNTEVSSGSIGEVLGVWGFLLR